MDEVNICSLSVSHASHIEFQAYHHHEMVSSSPQHVSSLENNTLHTHIHLSLEYCSCDGQPFVAVGRRRGGRLSTSHRRVAPEEEEEEEEEGTGGRKEGRNRRRKKEAEYVKKKKKVLKLRGGGRKSRQGADGGAAPPRRVGVGGCCCWSSREECHAVGEGVGLECVRSGVERSSFLVA